MWTFSYYVLRNEHNYITLQKRVKYLTLLTCVIFNNTNRLEYPRTSLHVEYMSMSFDYLIETVTIT